MAIHDAQSRVTEVWQQVNDQWHITCQYWRDLEQQKFEATYWRELEQETNDYMRSLEGLAEAIHAAETVLGD